MKSKVIAVVILTTLISVAFALSQFNLLPNRLYVDGVSNDGTVFGSRDWNGSFYAWDPDTGQLSDIGGISGTSRACCSVDGNYLSGSFYTQLPSSVVRKPGLPLVSGQLLPASYRCYSYRNARFADRIMPSDSPGILHQSNANYRGIEMARYDVAAGEWTILGTIGSGTGYGTCISGDGNTVAGIALLDNIDVAIVWNESEGLTSIGGDGVTQAINVNHDGSVIVGMQVFNNEYFKSAVWRKNPAGGYFPFETLLVDPSGDPNDPNNVLGDAWAVSGNGEWIGGFGDEATDNQPWIWSEATGCILLGDLGLSDGYVGTVSAFDHQGTTVVGYFSNFGGRPWPVTPFIWTQENGMQDLNVYATQTLGLDLGSETLKWVEAISANGQYLAGRIAAGHRGFRIQIGDSATPGDTVVPAALSLDRIYPNPFSSDTNIEYKLKEASQVKLSIYNQRGQLVKLLVSEGKNAGTHTVSWDGRDANGRKVSSGIYFARLNSGKESSHKKLIYIAE